MGKEFYRKSWFGYDGVKRTSYHMASYVGNGLYNGDLMITENANDYTLDSPYAFPVQKHELESEGFEPITEADFIVIAKMYIEYINSTLINCIIKRKR